MRLPLLLATTVLINACTAIPTRTLYHLWRFDLASADGAVLRVAVALPRTLEPVPDGTGIQVVIATPGAAPVTRRFRMQPDEDSALRAELTASAVHADQRLYVYRLADPELASLRTLQAQQREAATTGHAGQSLTLGVESKACHRDELPAGPLRSTVYLRPSAELGFLPLLVDQDLREYLDAAQLQQNIPRCEAAPQQTLSDRARR